MESLIRICDVLDCFAVSLRQAPRFQTNRVVCHMANILFSFWAEKFGTDRVLSNKSGTGLAPKRGGME